MLSSCARIAARVAIVLLASALVLRCERTPQSNNAIVTVNAHHHSNVNLDEYFSARPRQIFFARTHKTASSSMADALRFAGADFDPPLQQWIPTFPYRLCSRRWRMNIESDYVLAARFFHKANVSCMDMWLYHVVYDGVGAFESFVEQWRCAHNEPPLYISMLREPIRQMISVFYHRHYSTPRNKRPINDEIREWYEHWLRAVAAERALRSARNQSLTSIDKTDRRFLPQYVRDLYLQFDFDFEGGLQQMKRLLQRDDWLFLIGERFEESLLLLSWQAHFEPRTLPIFTSNVNFRWFMPGDYSYTELSDPQLRRFLVEIVLPKETAFYRDTVLAFNAKLRQIPLQALRERRNAVKAAFPEDPGQNNCQFAEWYWHQNEIVTKSDDEFASEGSPLLNAHDDDDDDDDDAGVFSEASDDSDSDFTLTSRSDDESSGRAKVVAKADVVYPKEPPEDAVIDIVSVYYDKRHTNATRFLHRIKNELRRDYGLKEFNTAEIIRSRHSLFPELSSFNNTEEATLASIFAFEWPTIVTSIILVALFVCFFRRKQRRFK